MEKIDRALVAETHVQVCHLSIHFSNAYVFLHVPNQDEHKINNHAYKWKTNKCPNAIILIIKKT
jgi:hypothetical protein